MKKKKKFNPLKCVNGVRGAIALFMAVLMTPFLTILMMLVEVGRYNSAVSVVDEALGVSAVSTLADYDEYLQDRWGVLALSQGMDMDTTFSETVKENIGVMGESVSINSADATGIYSVVETEILYSQIMEYSKLNSPTVLATNFLNLQDLISSLEEFEDIGEFLNIITSGTEAVDSTITLVEAAEELKTTADKLEGLVNTYESSYTNFETAVNTLIEALSQPKPSEMVKDINSLTEEEIAELLEQDREYEENLQRLRENAVTQKTKYSEVISSIITNLSDFRTKMNECSESLISIQNNIINATSKVTELTGELSEKNKDLEALEKEIKRMESEGYSESTTAYVNALDYRAALEQDIAELSTKSGLENAMQEGMSTVANGWEEAFATYSDSAIGDVITGFEGLQGKIAGFDCNQISANTTKISREGYKSIAISGYITSANIDAYLDAQEAELAEGSLSAVIDGIKTFFNTILNLKIFYDPELSAYIDINYYNETFGGLPGGSEASGGVIGVVTSIGNIIKDINEFSSSLQTLRFLTALKKIKSLLVDIGELIKSLQEFAVGICQNIAELLTTYDRIYYSTYTAFNLPCRTDSLSGAVSFSTMTGYQMRDGSLPSQNMISTPGVGFDDLAALIDMIKSSAAKTGDDFAFSGAELEYVLYGSNSEVANQLYAFVTLYLVRLIMNIPAVMANAEVQALAAASTFGYPVVMFLEILAEPLADAVLLVNGGSIQFYKTTIFLTPTGLPQLLAELVSICKLTSEDKEKIKTDLVSAFGATDDDYDYQKKLVDYEQREANGNGGILQNLTEFNYREYCFFILLLTVTKEQQMARISNLMQMEGLYYYKTKNAPYVFDLRNSYTYILGEADVSVKQMLPSLADSSLFNVKRQVYRGY